VGARLRHDLGRLGEYVEQTRIGEARLLIRGMLMLGSQEPWNGLPLPHVARQIEQAASELEARVARPLSPDANLAERFQRAQDLAMLGETQAALAALDAVREPSAAAEVELLRGALYENAGAWDLAQQAFQRAQRAWEAQGPSAAQTAGLQRAITGIAYSQRKSGQYTQAEASYRQLLALSPTADSHFLFAQFYEDAQHTAKAHEHARLAVRLAPDRFQQSADALIKKLSVYHFGCLGVMWESADAKRTSGSDPDNR
jgi:tetratricopeptide (TPR) repeat protein